MAYPRKPMSMGGKAWLLLIATPPLLILAGLVAMFAWHISQGTLSPKWRKPAPAPTTGAPVVDRGSSANSATNPAGRTP